MILLKVILLLAMLYIAYEDFRFRAVSIYSLIVFLIAAIVYSIWLQGFKPTIHSIFWNFLIIAFQMIMTFLYFIIIKKQRKSFVNQTIGLGDLLFYIPVLFLFSPLNFIFIHILSLIAVLTGFAIYTAVIKPVKTIPLAGALSIIMSLTLAASWIFKPAMFYDDLLIADFLYSLNL